MRLLLQMRQQRGCEADGAQKIGGNNRLGIGQIGCCACRFSARIMPALFTRTFKAGNSAVTCSAKARIAAGICTSRRKDFIPGLAAVASSSAFWRRPARMT